jgi:hypothetical protein
MTFRSSAVAIAFFTDEAEGKKFWTMENVTGSQSAQNRMIQNVQIYTLSRGPSNLARFLFLQEPLHAGMEL